MKFTMIRHAIRKKVDETSIAQNSYNINDKCHTYVLEHPNNNLVNTLTHFILCHFWCGSRLMFNGWCVKDEVHQVFFYSFFHFEMDMHIYIALVVNWNVSIFFTFLFVHFVWLLFDKLKIHKNMAFNSTFFQDISLCFRRIYPLKLKQSCHYTLHTSDIFMM